MQNSVLDKARDACGGHQVSADLLGHTCRVLETRRGGVTLCLPGACGDVGPRARCVYDTLTPDGTRQTVRLSEQTGWDTVTALGDELAGDIEDALTRCTHTLPLRPIRMYTSTLSVPRQMRPFSHFPEPSTHFQSVPDGSLDTQVELLCLGDSLALVGVQPELCACTGVQVQQVSPYPATWLVQMVNGAQKYMADAVSYTRGTYEAMSGFAGPGAAEQLVAHLQAFFNEASL